ncbi:YraN family protein [Croceicoccus sp. Ery15]|uniref:YraN family protein n=1 Tax=Croceicoccus sp. Ery15 TaxID=1703338 RepID=UPI001E4C7FF7|nr:YraN family protein [Croceicoccus sp. Ery15]
MKPEAIRRIRAEKQGRRGEEEAALFLHAGGWDILARRVRNAAGEVDLVARKGRVVAFIEVKWRQHVAGLDNAIDARRLARVCAAAEAEAHRFVQEGDDMRIDVLLLAPGHAPRHLENAGLF